MSVKTFISLVVTVLLLAACGTSSGPSNVTVKDAWSRPAAQGQVGGAYMQIENGGGTDRVMSLTSDVSDIAEIHESKDDNGMMTMLPVQGGLEVPAGGKVELKPGSYHVMLMSLKRELKVGETYKITLKLLSGKLVETDVQVRAN